MISKATYELLQKMVELAEQRDPIQGKFDFEDFNLTSNQPGEKEGVHNCGTAGCLAGGYLPLIDPKLFYFETSGTFMEGDDLFVLGPLHYEMGDFFGPMFVAGFQSDIGLKDLLPGARKATVIKNARKVLELMKKDVEV